MDSKQSGLNSLSIVSLNIEFNRHLPQVISFLNKQSADVLLLQEVLEQDLIYLSNNLKMKYIFAPLNKFLISEKISTLGIAIFSNLDFCESNIYYYSGNPKIIPTLSIDEPQKMRRAVVAVRIIFKSTPFNLLNTHFTWTPNGEVTPRQVKDLKSLFKVLKQFPDFVMCGDFNAPRGKTIFDKLASRFKDNIPPNIASTLDPFLHRAKGLKLVVDGVFSTPEYQVSDVNIKSGVSDHCAIVAKVSKS